MNGAGQACNAANAPINFTGAGAPDAENSKISSQKGTCSGILFTATGSAALYITETTISDNGGGAGTAGVVIKNQSSNILNVTIANSFINNDLTESPRR